MQSARPQCSSSSHCRERALAQGTGPQAPNGLIKYVVIPSSSFREWAHCHPNFMIFDLRAHRERNARHKSIPDPLQISPRDLSGLLKWLSPESTVVVSGGDATERIDANSESTLFRLGIDVIVVWTEALRSVDCSLASGRNQACLLKKSLG